MESEVENVASKNSFLDKQARAYRMDETQHRLQRIKPPPSRPLSSFTLVDLNDLCAENISADVRFAGKITTLYPLNTFSGLFRFVLSSTSPTSSGLEPTVEVYIKQVPVSSHLPPLSDVLQTGSIINLSGEAASWKFGRKISYDNGCRLWANGIEWCTLAQTKSLKDMENATEHPSYASSSSRKTNMPPLSRESDLSIEHDNDNPYQQEAPLATTPDYSSALRPVFNTHATTTANESNLKQRKQQEDNNTSVPEIAVPIPYELASDYIPFIQLKDKIAFRFNLIGVIVRVGPVKTTKSKEYFCNIVLIDPSKPSSNDGLACNLFSKTDNLPELAVGEVILLREVFRTEFRGRPQAVGGANIFEWITLDSEDNVKRNRSVNISKSEAKYMQSIRDWYAELYGIKKKKSKLRSISSVVPDEYFDCVAEVISKQAVEDRNGTKVLPLLITDYTCNDLILRRSHLNSKLKGPFGCRVVQILLFDEHAEAGGIIDSGNYVSIKNIRPKLDYNGRLEFLVHGGDMDYSGTAKINVLKIRDEDDHRLMGLLRRKNAYWSAFETAKQGTVNNEPKDPIVCDFGHLGRSTLNDIITNGKDGVLYRLHGRIVDYLPKSFREFKSRECSMCSKRLDLDAPYCTNCNDVRRQNLTSHWHFAFLFEDGMGENGLPRVLLEEEDDDDRDEEEENEDMENLTRKKNKNSKDGDEDGDSGTTSWGDSPKWSQFSSQASSQDEALQSPITVRGKQAEHFLHGLRANNSSDEEMEKANQKELKRRLFPIIECVRAYKNRNWKGRIDDQHDDDYDDQDEKSDAGDDDNEGNEEKRRKKKIRLTSESNSSSSNVDIIFQQIQLEADDKEMKNVLKDVLGVGAEEEDGDNGNVDDDISSKKKKKRRKEWKTMFDIVVKVSVDNAGTRQISLYNSQVFLEKAFK